jgi:hypothetical protein
MGNCASRTREQEEEQQQQRTRDKYRAKEVVPPSSTGSAPHSPLFVTATDVLRGSGGGAGGRSPRAPFLSPSKGVRQPAAGAGSGGSPTNSPRAVPGGPTAASQKAQEEGAFANPYRQGLRQPRLSLDGSPSAPPPSQPPPTQAGARWHRLATSRSLFSSGSRLRREGSLQKAAAATAGGGGGASDAASPVVVQVSPVLPHIQTTSFLTLALQDSPQKSPLSRSPLCPASPNVVDGVVHSVDGAGTPTRPTLHSPAARAPTPQSSASDFSWGGSR